MHNITCTLVQKHTIHATHTPPPHHTEWVANGSAGVVDATTITSTSSTSSTSSTPTQPPPTPTPTDHSHPPVLVPGSDDIFWMSKLHAALATQGFHSGDEDMEDWYFGPSTQSALLTFQACNGLEESGVTDQPTWRALLGEQGYVDMVSGVPSVDAAGAQSAGAAAATRKGASRVVVDKWPTLHEGDGGRFVHAMHVLLEQAGYWPGEDDFQWWWFGDGTLAALKAYQVGVVFWCLMLCLGGVGGWGLVCCVWCVVYSHHKLMWCW